MARPTKQEKLDRIYDEARAEYNRVYSALQDERQQCVQDRRFYSIAGAQWEDELGEQFENRPKFEVNKVHLSVIRIINEYRNNRVSADFVPRDGSTDADIADMCDGLYRADEQDSCAEEAYDNAFEEAVGGGFGAWRLRNCYENEYDDEDDRQRIRFEPIYDADTSVFFDLDAKRQDKSDAKHCWVVYTMTPEAYEAEWGDSPTSWPKDSDGTQFDWCTPDVVYVAEYYRVEEVKETLVYYMEPAANAESKMTLEEYEESLEEGELDDVIETRRRTVKTRKVRKYIMSGGGILEDLGYIAGQHIPIIPVYGKRWFVDNIERCMGHVRLAKDVQRMKNMVVSWLAEIAGTSPQEVPMVDPQQISGFETYWENHPIENYAYLPLRSITDAEGNVVQNGPIGFTKPPQIPPAIAAMLQILDIDMAEILGNQQQGDKMVSNISGKAVEMIQNRIDGLAFIYLSNFAKAARRCGEVWLSMAKDIYTEPGRKMKAVGEMGNIESIELGKVVIDEKSGGLRDSTDLSRADLDVTVDVGPTSKSQREATVRGLTGMMQLIEDPADRKILGALALMNMDGEGLSEAQEYFRKQMVQIGVLQPNDEELKAMQEAAASQEPTPEQKYLEAEAQKSMAEAGYKLADTEKTIAETEKVKADTVKTLSEIGQPTGPQ